MKKNEKQRFYGQNKLLSQHHVPWGVSTTWLHVEAPQKIQEK
jgi:hypothetical protein